MRYEYATGEGRDEASGGRVDLLYRRVGEGVDVGVQGTRPDIGEAEISAVHVLFCSEKYWRERSSRWLLASVDTHLSMIVSLGMSCGCIVPLGEGTVQVTVRHVWVHTSWLAGCTSPSANCRTGANQCRPKDGFRSWCPDDPDKVRLFVPLGGLRLPSYGIPSTVPGDVGVRSEKCAGTGLFAEPIVVQENEM